MRNKFDNILLGTLWLLLSTLGACFWFNTRFGFNILSGTHWRHLAYMQVTQTQIKPSFYISIIVTVFCIVFGLYLLIRPRFRKITLPQTATKEEQTQPIISETKPNDADIFALARPKRLNGTTATTTSSTQIKIMTAPVAGTAITPQEPQTKAPAIHTTNTQKSTEMMSIFSSAGYIIKKSATVEGYQIPLIAVDSMQQLWIGGENIETTVMQKIVDSFQQIFCDTLEDIDIPIIGFVVNPVDIANPVAPNILIFKTDDELRTYMMENPNPPLDPDMSENCEAFSTFISTVIDYIGRL